MNGIYAKIILKSLSYVVSLGQASWPLRVFVPLAQRREFCSGLLCLNDVQGCVSEAREITPLSYRETAKKLGGTNEVSRKRRLRRGAC